MVTKNVAMAIGLSILAGAAFAEEPAAATNLLKNAAFNSGVSEWLPAVPSATVVFRATTGSTLPGGSGSGCIEVQLAKYRASAGTYQDISVSPGRRYQLAVSAFVPPDDNPVLQVGVSIHFWDSADKPINNASTAICPLPTPKGGWTRTTGAAVAPPNAARARFHAWVRPTSSSTETRKSVAYFDDMVMAELGSAKDEVKEYFLPVASSKAGQSSTFWTTMVWMTTLASTETKVYAAFLSPGQDNSSAVANPVSLGEIVPGTYYSKADFAGFLGGNDRTGAIYLRAETPAENVERDLLQVTSRNATRNPTGNGNYGQAVIGVEPGTKRTTHVAGVCVNDQFRTNVGVVNTSDKTITVRIELWAGSIVPVTSVSWTLKPYEPRMVSAANLGAATMVYGTAHFALTSVEGSFRGFVSVVDNGTQDSIYAPAL